MKVLLSILALSSAVFSAEPPTDLIGPQKNEAQPRLEGIWYKNCGKGQRATKWYGQGHMAVTVFDDKGEVISHHEGTWVMDGAESIERVLVTTSNWKQLRGRLMRAKISCPDSSTIREDWGDGNVEEWHRVP